MQSLSASLSGLMSPFQEKKSLKERMLEDVGTAVDGCTGRGRGY